MTASLRIDARFEGPPGVGNGGYVAGRLAASLATDAAEVRLRRPVPVGRDLSVGVAGDGSAELRSGGDLLADARPIELAFDVPPMPDPGLARGVEGTCRAFESHPFPGCFVCGPARGADGLRILPGPGGPEGGVVGCWTPTADLAHAGRVEPPFIWAALDCISVFPLLEDPDMRHLEPMVLGALRVRVLDPPRPGEGCVVAAWPVGSEGRRATGRAALYREDGGLAGISEGHWFSIADRHPA